MKKILCVFLVVLCATVLFAGGDAEDGDKKVIRVASQSPGLITPGLWDGQVFALNPSVYDYFVELDPKTRELVPSLATEWSSADGKRWEFKLREGVVFHDGTPFTSEDARFTLERTQFADIGHLQKDDFSIIDSIETPDDYTMIINLAEVRPTFIYLLTAYNMCVLSSEYDYLSYGETAPMGTGPFRLKVMVPKEYALLVKNESYWSPGLPKLDELRIYFVPDLDSSVAMLMAGEADVVPYISTIHKNTLEAAGFKVISPYQEQRFLALAADREPFSDNRVRLAMKYAMDPEILAQACQGELGVDIEYNETPIMNKLSQYSEIPHRGRDIEKARQLLSEAGYPDGVSVELFYASDHPYSKPLSQAIKELAAPAGFEIELKGFSRDVYLAQYWMNAPMLLTGWGPRVDPSMLLMLAFQSGGPWNESHIDDPELDRLIFAINGEVNDDTRQGYYKELQELFYERGTTINIQVPYYVGLSPKVIDYRQPLTLVTQYEYTDYE